MSERYRKKVFCEWAFFEKYLDEISNVRDHRTESTDNIILDYLPDLIFSSEIKLFIDLDVDEFYTKRKDIDNKIKNSPEREKYVKSAIVEFINQLFDKQHKGELHLKCQGDKFVHIENLQSAENLELDAIYIIPEEKDSWVETAQDFGIMAISPNNAREIINLSKDNGVALNKSEENNWHKILRAKTLKCNSMIIVDNYLLNDTNLIGENLISILDEVLPQSLPYNIPFHLSVLTVLEQGLDLNPRYSQILKSLKEIRPDLYLKFTILLCEKCTFHDRTIITNNMYISSGGGFDLFKNNKARKSTIINVLCPVFNYAICWSRIAYSNLLTSIQELWRKKKIVINGFYPYFYIGDGVNRLLDY